MNTSIVSARRERVTIPTYPVGPADPTPPVRRRWGYWRIYPYSMLDDLYAHTEDRVYEALILENEFLKVTVLPEIGGHLYAFDKSAERDIFYRPAVIKPGLVALCGAWIAGGIEFNFPCSHNPQTFRPVDHRMEENPDGSATIFIGAVEQLSRMRWTVAITLRSGVARVETDIRLENRTPLPHRYYFWSNSAERVTNGTRFITTAPTVYGWQGIMRYPVHEGKYLPAYKDHTSACDLFSRHVRGDFFGCYDDDAEEGVVHVADRNVVTGRKYFTWGNSGDGLVWQHILGDDAGPYIEIQSGPFETQSIFKLMEPHQVVRWRECWYGVRDTGGFEFANRDLALNLVREASGGTVVAYATRRIDDATVEATAQGRTVGRWTGTLSPGKPVRVAVESLGDNVPVSVHVASQEGGIVAEATLPWQFGPDDLADSPLVEPEARETVEGLSVQGYAHEQQFDWEQARRCYERALECDPRAPFPLVRLGILDLKANRAEQALALLDRAAHIRPDDGEVSYYRGLALRRTGRRAEAADAFWKARLSPWFGALGRYVLGEMAAEDGDTETALEHFMAASTTLPIGTKAWCGGLVMLRALGRFDDAEVLDEQMAEEDALNPLVLCERALRAEALLGRLPGVWDEVRQTVQDEPQSWLELAGDYAALGRLKDALRILDVTATSDDPALVHYYRAYYLSAIGDHDRAETSGLIAAVVPDRMVYPHRLEAEAVLRDAATKNPADGNARYLLGTLLYMLGRTSEGVAYWRMAAERRCLNASLYRCLAFAARSEGDMRVAQAHMEAAAVLRPDDFRLHTELDTLREETGVPPAERLAALTALPESVRERGAIPSRMGHLSTLVERYDEAILILKSHRFNPWEGEMAMRSLYTSAHVGKGERLTLAGDAEGARACFEEALDYPVNVAVGKPLRSADAPIRYRAGLAASALGDDEAAREHWREGAEETHHPLPSLPRFYAECCRRALGHETDAVAAFGAMRHALEERMKATKPTADEYLLVGLTRRALGDADGARVEYDKALAMNPYHLFTRIEREKLAASLGQT